MENEVKLTAIEVYFLGKYMGARYIDYKYISEMPGIQEDYLVHEQITLESLKKKNVIGRKFSGEVSFPEATKQLFEPVFFGKKESKLENGEVYRFHILGSRMTMARIEEEGIRFRRVYEEDIEELLKGNVKVVCADVEKGMCEKNFSEEQLLYSEYREEVIRILKGEM